MLDGFVFRGLVGSNGGMPRSPASSEDRAVLRAVRVNVPLLDDSARSIVLLYKALRKPPCRGRKAGCPSRMHSGSKQMVISPSRNLCLYQYVHCEKKVTYQAQINTHMNEGYGILTSLRRCSSRRIASVFFSSLNATAEKVSLSPYMHYLIPKGSGLYRKPSI